MNYIIKSAIIGDYGVGKTSIVNRYSGKNFYENETPTLGVDFIHKVVKFQDNTYKLQIWDTAGQEKFESIVKSYIRDLNVCILVYDVNNQKSFKRVKKWLDDVEYIVTNPIYICLVGTKTDLDMREVEIEKVQDFCIKNNLDYMECSAKNRKNIDEIFSNIIDKIDIMLKKNEIVLRTYGDFIVKQEPTKIKEKCCIIS